MEKDLTLVRLRQLYAMKKTDVQSFLSCPLTHLRLPPTLSFSCVPPALVSFSGTIYHEQSSETIDDATIYNGSSANEVVLSLGKKCLMVNGEARLSAEL